MLPRRLLLAGLLALLVLLGATGVVQAQIRIGQTAGLTGAVAGLVTEASDGARLYFDSVNARGGIGGQKLEMVSLDDPFEPKLAAENARTLIGQGVTALFVTRCDLGGLALSYGATDHTGLDCADLPIIGADGRFRR